MYNAFYPAWFVEVWILCPGSSHVYLKIASWQYECWLCCLCRFIWYWLLSILAILWHFIEASWHFSDHGRNFTLWTPGRDSVIQLVSQAEKSVPWHAVHLIFDPKLCLSCQNMVHRLQNTCDCGEHCNCWCAWYRPNHTEMVGNNGIPPSSHIYWLDEPLIVSRMV